MAQKQQADDHPVKRDGLPVNPVEQVHSSALRAVVEIYDGQQTWIEVYVYDFTNGIFPYKR
ncbi:hypothetical protein Pme01_11780 [Planosporangium mesophilum]|uniref:Uncharacterized protein n=1 Tax=Planosporangium mesophilum TaxID=689768 RepID=A0A8J3TA96_9ACTN|nr:hypothetical protein Pme01_11780 [Planosporangium mesophilum]